MEKGQEQLNTIMAILRDRDPDAPVDFSVREPVLDMEATLRGSKEIYASFVALCSDCVVHHSRFKNKASSSRSVSEWFTVHDEALCMVILENCVYKWNSEYTLRRELNRESNNNELHLDAVLHLKLDRAMKNSLPRTKYSERVEGEGTNRGWSLEGVERFMVIKTKVEETRQTEQQSTWMVYAADAIKTMFRQNASYKGGRIRRMTGVTDESNKRMRIMNNSNLSEFSSSSNTTGLDNITNQEAV